MELKSNNCQDHKPPKGRFLVSFEAFYTFDRSFFDHTVEWDEQDPEELRDMLREHIRTKYCNGRKDVHIGVTILSIFKLKPKAKG